MHRYCEANFVHALHTAVISTTISSSIMSKAVSYTAYKLHSLSRSSMVHRIILSKHRAIRTAFPERATEIATPSSGPVHLRTPRPCTRMHAVLGARKFLKKGVFFDKVLGNKKAVFFRPGPRKLGTVKKNVFFTVWLKVKHAI